VSFLPGLDVKVTGTESVRHYFENLLSAKRLQAAGDEAAKRLEKVFREMTPVSKDPDVDPKRGDLQKSWQGVSSLSSMKNELDIQVRNTDPRARQVWPILLFGQRSHPIKIRNRRFLVFLMRNRQTFVGKSVRHPGSQPKIEERIMTARVNAEVNHLKQRILTILKTGHA